MKTILLFAVEHRQNPSEKTFNEIFNDRVKTVLMG